METFPRVSDRERARTGEYGRKPRQLDGSTLNVIQTADNGQLAG